MNKIANSPKQQRSELFAQTAFEIIQTLTFLEDEINQRG